MYKKFFFSSLNVSHQTMSSVWGYVIPVTESVLAMSGRGGGCIKPRWSLLVLPCSSTCICQLVAFRTQAQKALWDTFSQYWTAYKSCGWLDQNVTQNVLYFLILDRRELYLYPFFPQKVKWFTDISIKSGKRVKKISALLCQSQKQIYFSFVCLGTIYFSGSDCSFLSDVLFFH